MALRSSGTDAQFLRNMQGIESVKQIVRKYNGEIDFKYDKDFFEVEIIISDNT